MYNIFPLKFERFLKYSSIGISTFAFDLVLLSLFTGVLGVHYLIATGFAFLIAVSVNYFLSRRFAFKETERQLASGYVYFLQFAIGAMALTTFLMWLLSNTTEAHYLLVRVVIACVVGTLNYLLNLYFNFRVAGKHSEESPVSPL